MKSFTLIIGAAFAALFISTPAAADETPASDAEANAGAIMACMDKGKDGQSQSTCVMGVALIAAISKLGGPGGAPTAAAAPPMVVMQQPPQGGFVEGLKSVFAGLGAILAPMKDTTIALAPAVAQVLAARTNAHTQEVIAGYNRDTTLGAYNAFTTMGSSIERAGTAGYPYVQASGPVNNYTLSGTGVIGSGTYTGPVTSATTTTRTCSGGQAGNGGGTTTGAAGGSGGAATC